MPYRVLFLCECNNARSLMAEAILNHAHSNRFEAVSAGSRPTAPHRSTLDLLNARNHDTSTLNSKNWEIFSGPGAPKIDFIFTLCHRIVTEDCPVWQDAHPTAHWNIPDPIARIYAGIDKNAALAETYRLLNNRITVFASLPRETLDGLAFRPNLENVG